MDPVQSLILFLNCLSFLADLIMSGSVFHSMLPLNLREFNPYLTVFVLGSWTSAAHKTMETWKTLKGPLFLCLCRIILENPENTTHPYQYLAFSTVPFFIPVPQCRRVYEISGRKTAYLVSCGKQPRSPTTGSKFQVHAEWNVDE